jgi:cytochrome d ubiquinol oxidase subunit II
MNAIGPVWDGNEVWLLTAGGALFAAFPVVYATIFSGFYLALVSLLVALIFRAVALEFRSKVESTGWRRAWDLAFGLGSLVPALLLGVALANVMRGLPLDTDGEYRGGLLGLLDPFTLVVGLLSVAMCVVHGAAWLIIRTGGAVQERARAAAVVVWPIYAGLWVVASLAALSWAPTLFDVYGNPLAFATPLVVAGALLAFRRLVASPETERLAILASGLSIAGMIGLVGQGLYPRLVPSTGGLAADTTVASAASSDTALTAMLIVALVGMPLVVIYTAWIYRRFSVKVQLDDDVY